MKETALHWHLMLSPMPLGPEFGVSQVPGPRACLCSLDTCLCSPVPVSSSCSSPVTYWPVCSHPNPVCSSPSSPTKGALTLSSSPPPHSPEHPAHWSRCPHKATEQNEPRPRGFCLHGKHYSLGTLATLTQVPQKPSLLPCVSNLLGLGCTSRSWSVGRSFDLQS